MTDTPPVDATPVRYPDTTVGMLMRDRDRARDSAAAALREAARFQASYDENTARATSLQAAIDAMGGDQEMVPVADGEPAEAQIVIPQATLDTPEQ